MNKKQIREALRFVQKAGVVAVTAPATWVVAGEAFADVAPIVRPVIQAAAVLLVEGIYLQAMFSLEDDTHAEAADRVLYAVQAWAMLLAMWVIALQHGEGPAGLMFRLSAVVVTAAATWENVTQWVAKLNRSADRGNDHRVRRHDRKMTRLEAIAKRNVIHQIKRAKLEAWREVALERVTSVRDVKLERVKLVHQNDLSKVHQEFKPAANGHGSADHKSENSREMNLRNGGRGVDVSVANDARLDQVEAKKRADYDALAAALKINPDATIDQLAAVIGMSTSTVKRRLQDMNELGLIPGRTNGRR